MRAYSRKTTDELRLLTAYINKHIHTLVFNPFATLYTTAVRGKRSESQMNNSKNVMIWIDWKSREAYWFVAISWISVFFFRKCVSFRFHHSHFTHFVWFFVTSFWNFRARICLFRFCRFFLLYFWFGITNPRCTFPWIPFWIGFFFRFILSLLLLLLFWAVAGWVAALCVWVSCVCFFCALNSQLFFSTHSQSLGAQFWIFFFVLSLCIDNRLLSMAIVLIWCFFLFTSCAHRCLELLLLLLLLLYWFVHYCYCFLSTTLNVRVFVCLLACLLAFPSIYAGFIFVCQIRFYFVYFLLLLFYWAYG